MYENESDLSWHLLLVEQTTIPLGTSSGKRLAVGRLRAFEFCGIFHVGVIFKRGAKCRRVFRWPKHRRTSGLAFAVSAERRVECVETRGPWNFTRTVEEYSARRNAMAGFLLAKLSRALFIKFLARNSHRNLLPGSQREYNGLGVITTPSLEF